MQRDSGRAPLGELAILFLKLGTLAFGGPAAHIAIMRQEVVDRRKWLTDAEFLDLLGAANLIPGPSSTELAIHIGFRKAGWMGLVLAGVCFILPAALIVLGLAMLYQRWHTLPQVAGVMYGVKPVVVAIVLQALRALALSALRTKASLAVAFVGFALASAGVHELVVLIGCGLLLLLIRSIKAGQPSVLPLFMPAAIPKPRWAVLAVTSPLLASHSLWRLFLVFLKIGSVAFGSGYVLLAFLKSDLVDRLHWLTSRQLLDAVAVGQITPGPVFTTATFIGYLLAGIPGALLGTIAIFLPGFLFVSISGPLIPKIRQSPAAAAALDGVTVGSLALIAWVLVALGRAALVDLWSIALALACILLLFRFRINSVWLILAGGTLGALLSLRG
ncbi:MAG: chromate efflux transporter [Acidobacteriaceae bacterium]|nr:chromate efflux transporter [Acidobacteriaceae bacterium]